MKKCVAIALIMFGSALTTSAGEKAKPSSLIVVNSRDKEVELKKWKFVEGVQTLRWLKSPVECILFRETNSTNYKDGIATLVPLTTVRKIEYDFVKHVVRLTAALPDGKDRVLTGTTRFVGINKIVIQGDVDLGDLGVASFKYRAGDGKGLKGVRFPNAVPLPESSGAKAIIVGNEKGKPEEHTVINPKPLYLANGDWRLLPHLAFYKTVKVKLDQIGRLRMVPIANKKQVSLEYDVKLADDKEFALTLMPEPTWDKKTKLSLVGIVGRVDVGYRLFPMHTIREFRWHKE